MKARASLFRAALLAGLTAALLGCAPQTTPPAALPPTGAPTPPATAPLSPDGLGSPIPLLDPVAGLAEQSSYRAWLRQDISGQIDGQPFERHTRLDLTRAGAQVDFTQALKSSAGADADTRVMQLGAALYRWQGPGPTCQGMEGEFDPDEIIEPARYLPAVRQAVRLGAETVNGIPSVHYRIDQIAGQITGDDNAGATGEMWVAETGGSVVRYILTVSGAELSQRWEYELKPVDPGEAVALPPDCLEVPLDLPIPADARDLARSSGWVVYRTETGALETANFYLQNLPPLGWSGQQKALTAAPNLPFAAVFTRAERHLSLSLHAGEAGGLEVTLFLSAAPAQAAALPRDAATQAEPTIDPAHSGLPADVPLYPGASGLIQAEGSLLFNAADGAESVAAFYREEMVARGWTLESELDAGGTFVQTWNQPGRSLMITIGPNEQGTYVVVTGE